MSASRVTPFLPSGVARGTVVRAFGASDVGLVRKTNEDSFVMAELSTGRRWRGGVVQWSTSAAGVLLAVSDGMGGANAGEVASALTVESLVRGMLESAESARPDGEALRRVIE